MSVRILIADDHEVVRQGLRTILKARPEWQICGEAENGQQAIECAKQLKPDIIILDITMPVMSGLEATQELSNLNLGLPVLIFTMHDSSSLTKALRKAGAQGYVLKSRAAHDLICAIETLIGGGTFFTGESSNGDREPEKNKHRSLLFRARIDFPPICQPA